MKWVIGTRYAVKHIKSQSKHENLIATKLDTPELNTHTNSSKWLQNVYFHTRSREYKWNCATRIIIDKLQNVSTEFHYLLMLF